MPTLNLMAPVTIGADDAEAQQGSVEIVNGFVDTSYGAPAIKMRPGLTLLHDMGRNARVDTYWWEAKRILIIVCARKVYAKTSATAEPVEITPLTSTHAPDFGAKTMFAADEYGVTMTTGRYLIWWGGDTSQRSTRITDANAPIAISSIAYLKGYMIASIPNTQTFQWAFYSGTDDRTQPPPWNPLSISASASPDDIICMAAGWEELFILGRESAQSHYASGDATIPFPALNGSVAETGTINANTLQKLGNAWIYFTPNYQVVRVEGRTPVVVSQVIDRKLRDLQYFSEAEAFVLFERFYVLTFRRDGQTFVYDLNTGLWYQWGTWDDEVIKYREFKGLSATHAKSWGLQIIGGADGKVYSASYDVGNDNSELIRFMVRSAHIDHGTGHRKFANTLQMRLRVGDNVQIGSGDFIPAVFGTDWVAEELLEEPLRDVLYATDGYVYILGQTKIWRTTVDFAVFTELTLDGTLTGPSFGTLAEVSNGRIVTMDNRYLWVMAAGTTTFTKTAYSNTFRYWGSAYPVTSAGPNSPLVFMHGTSGLGNQAAVDIYNLDTTVDLGWFGVTAAYVSAPVPNPGIVADNGDVLIVANNAADSYVWRYDVSTGTAVRTALSYGVAQNLVIGKGTDGKLYIYAHITYFGTEGKFWVSEDNGVTWAVQAIYATGLSYHTDIVGLWGAELFITALGRLYRTTDGFLTTGAQEFDFDHTAGRFEMLPNAKLVIVTNGKTTANVYTLQGIPAQETMIQATDRKLLIRWRNDGKGKWSDYREVSLGEIGEYMITRRLKSLGCYRTRQYEIVCTSGGPVTITGIEEDVALGGSGGR